MIYSDQDLSSFLLLYLTSWPDWWGVSPTSYISMNGVEWDGHLEMKLTHNNCVSPWNCVPFKWYLLRFVPLSLSFRCYRISTKDIIFSAKSAPETNLCLSLYCIVFVIVIFVFIVFVFAAAFIDQSWYFALFCLVCYRIQTSSPLKISFHGWHLFFPFVSFSIKGHQLLLHKETKTFDQIQGKILI